jgi:Arc/MetJ-type ribon-helix-helix transcriptional regulator
LVPGTCGSQSDTVCKGEWFERECIALRTTLYYMMLMSTATSRSRTITVRLPEALAEEIETESQKRGVSKSDIVRERLERAQRRTDLPPHLEAIADLIGSVDGLPEDLSSRKKDHLRRWGYGRKRHR